jgi:hypothetical protein
MPEQYKHQPLSTSRSIRLLQCKKHRPSVTSLNQLDLRLVEATLDDLPPYDALSYAWGDNNPTSSIVCEGRALPVTANCEAALREILPNDQDHFVWVDSLCIDQASTLERNQQVALMAEIFSNAKKVLIWLGESSKEIREAMNYMRWLSILEKIPFRPITELGLGTVIGTMKGT